MQDSNENPNQTEGPDTHVHGASTGIICNHVLRGERRVNLIDHLPDGTWDFMCGSEDGHDSADDVSVICGGCAFSDFVTGLVQDDVPPAHTAERPDPTRRWVIRPLTDEEIRELEED